MLTTMLACTGARRRQTNVRLGGLAALWLCRGETTEPGSSAAARSARIDGARFVRSGALVFGGGHVVLPLLREAFVAPGWLTDDAFLAGYGAAQAVPGPLFTFAAYLGSVVTPEPYEIVGAALGLLSILPGILVLLGALPSWDSFRKRPIAQAMMRGVNAAVVGVLGAALYDPVWTTSVRTPPTSPSHWSASSC